mgnify:CR=1 FL=1
MRGIVTADGELPGPKRIRPTRPEDVTAYYPLAPDEAQAAEAAQAATDAQQLQQQQAALDMLDSSLRRAADHKK